LHEILMRDNFSNFDFKYLENKVIDVLRRVYKDEHRMEFRFLVTGQAIEWGKDYRVKKIKKPELVLKDTRFIYRLKGFAGF